MRLSASLAAAAALTSLMLSASAAGAGIQTDGVTLGNNTGSGTNWSSDLGPDNFFGAFPDSINRGPGSSTPLRPEGSLFSGESFTNSGGPLVNFGGSTGVLSSSLKLDVAPGGPLVSALNHIHFDATVPGVAQYGMFVFSQLNTDTAFYGGVPGQPNFVYWAMQWAMTSDLSPDTQIRSNFLVDMGCCTSGGRVEVNNATPGNFGGSSFGVFQLRGGDTGGTVNNGNGFETQQFSFELGNGSGSSSPGGSAGFDAWWEFSDTPIDHVIFPDTGVPEPADWTLLIAGFGGIGAAMRRRRALSFA